MTKTQPLLLLFILSMGFAPRAYCAEVAPWLNVEVEANFDVRASSVDDYERHLHFEQAGLSFELLLREGIKIIIQADINEKLNQETAGQPIDIAAMLEEAYIQIETDKVSNLPRAVIKFGKQYMAFGQKYSALLLKQDSLFYKLTRQGEVIGLTVELPVNFFQLVDSAAFSVFETGPGDFKISEEKGASLRLKKQFSERLSAEISALIKQHPGGRPDEKRGSLGFILENKQGTRKLWVEGVLTEDKPGYDEHTMALQVGTSQQWGPGSIVIDFQYILNQAHELALAYNLPINSWLVISPEARWRKSLSENFEDETVLALQARIEAQLEKKHQLLTGAKKK